MPQNAPGNGQHDRLAHWVRRHGAAVRGFLLAATRRPDVADDLTQEVFRRALTASGYQESGNARSYLIRIADRLVCDAARRPAETMLDAAGWSAAAPVSKVPPPDDQLLRDEARRELNTALDQLTGPQRRVLLLRYYSQMPFVEIAEAMDAPLNTVLSHCRRGLLAMRKILAGNHE